MGYSKVSILLIVFTYCDITATRRPLSYFYITATGIKDTGFFQSMKTVYGLRMMLGLA